jgi:hypothetical protein
MRTLALRFNITFAALLESKQAGKVWLTGIPRARRADFAAL